MQRSSLLALLLFVMSHGAAAATEAADQPVHGPVKYDVKERYGKVNRYSGSLSASEAVYLIKLQLGEEPGQRPDYLELTVNGTTVVRDDRYPYRFIACFVKLKKDTTYQLVIKDEVPPSFRRPPLTPKNVILTVTPAAGGMKHLQGSFGVMKWDALKDVGDLFLKIQDPAAVALAMDAASVHLAAPARTSAMRSLTSLKDKRAEEYLVRMYGDHFMPVDIRAEAAIGLGLLGDKRNIPLLMGGLTDPDERISIASARALSFYPEEDTQKQLTEILQRLDPMRRGAAIRTIVNGGWKPVNTIISLAETDDPKTFTTAVGILGGMRDPRATEYLLKLLSNPGKRDMRQIIAALGETKDPRSADALLAIAGDPAKRSGVEADLGEALASLGDQRAAGPIAEMSKKATLPSVRGRLASAYKKLTGKDAP
jgi:HEAT repeat protein